MGDSFPRGLPGAGSQGDPALDAALTEEVADLLLAGMPRRAALSPDLRPLRETVDALRAGPSWSELAAESRVLAAFRDICGPSLDDTIVDGPAGKMADTLRLEMLREPEGPRRSRARHRARPGGRPPARPDGLPRPAMRRPRVVGTVAALALLAVVGIFAYAGSLPGPIQDAAHVAFGAPPVKTTAASPPTEEANGSARASASPMTGARAIRPSTATGPRPSANAAPAGPKQLCLAYLANPWRPGATSWDKSDFEKLAKASPGGPAWVLWYCSKYVNIRHQADGLPLFFPLGFPGGSWAWTPDHGLVTGPGSTGNDPGPGSTAGTGPLPGPAGGPGPARVAGQSGTSGHSEDTPGTSR